MARARLPEDPALHEPARRLARHVHGELARLWLLLSGLSAVTLLLIATLEPLRRSRAWVYVAAALVLGPVLCAAAFHRRRRRLEDAACSVILEAVPGSDH